MKIMKKSENEMKMSAGVMKKMKENVMIIISKDIEMKMKNERNNNENNENNNENNEGIEKWK